MRIWNILPLLEASAVTGMAIADVVGRGKKRGKAVGSTLSRPENTSLFLRKEKDQKEIGVFLYLDFFQRIAQKKKQIPPAALHTMAQRCKRLCYLETVEKVSRLSRYWST